jgi:hypothetical protein
MLEEGERARLAALTRCDEDAVERIIATAVAECLVVILPPFRTAGDFAGWDTFVWEGQAKAAHLAEVGAHRALCGAPRPNTSEPAGARVRLCIGCESHIRALVQSPGAIAAYDRGKAPAELGDSPLPPLRRPHPAAASPEPPPSNRAAPRGAAARRSPPQSPAAGRPPDPPPPAEPKIEATPSAPSLFDAPVSAPRARPRRPF